MGLITTTDNAYYTGSDHGNYQFTDLSDIIDSFIIAYVGEGKIFGKCSRIDVQFHAHRAMQEFSFDTFKSTKAQEIEVPNTLQMILPKDYVNYIRLSFVDNVGVFHTIYPIKDTGNPTAIKQDGAGAYVYSGDNLDLQSESDAWGKFKAADATNQDIDYEYDDDTPFDHAQGRRYGLDPSYAQGNGHYYIDEKNGKIHFSSNLSGKTIVLEYISDSLGTDSEMKVHKFAEEAMYKQIAYAIASTRANMPEYVVQRFKREAFATRRTAKLRLSNIKFQEIVQVLRGKSKHIKH